MDDQDSSKFGVIVGTADTEESDDGTTVTVENDVTTSLVFRNKSTDGTGTGIPVYISKVTTKGHSDTWTLIDLEGEGKAGQINISLDVDGTSNYICTSLDSTGTGITKDAEMDTSLSIELTEPEQEDLDSNGRTTSVGMKVKVGGNQGSYANYATTDLVQAFTVEWFISTKDYSTTETEE